MAKQAIIDVIINNEAAKKKYEELQGELKKIKILRDDAMKAGDVTAWKVYDAELKTARKDLNGFVNSFETVEQVLKNITKVSKNELTTAFKQAQSDLNGLARDSDKYASKKANFEKLRDEIDKINGGYKAQGSWLSKAGDATNKYFTLATAAIASFTGVFLGLKQTIADYNDYQKKVAGLSALTGLKGDELEWISNKAKEMSVMTTESGIRITNSADVIVDAFKKMGSARPDLLQNKEALAAVTKEALILSEAAELDLDASINAVAAALNSFDLQATDSAKIINIFAAGALAGNVEVVDLTASMKNVGAVAKDSNVSLEQSVAVLEILGKSDIKGEEAGTKFRGAMLKLKEAGVGYASGKFILRDALVEVNQMLEKHATAQEKDALKIKMFGAENVTVGTILTNNIDKYDELTKAVTGTNVAYEQAQTNTATNSARLEQQKNKIKLISIELGEKLAPIMSSSLGIFTKFMQVLIESIKFYQQHSYAVNTLAASISIYLAAIKLQVLWTSLNTKVEIDGIATSKLKLIQQKLSIIWTNIQTATTQLLAAAQMLLAGNTAGAGQAMRVFFNVIKANPLGFYLSLIFAVGAAIFYLFSKTQALTEAQKKAAQEAHLRSEVDQKAVESYGNQAAKLEILKRVVNDTTKSEKERKNALAEITKETNGVITVTDLNAQSLINLNTQLDNYKNKLKETARVQAASALITEKYKKMQEIEAKGLDEFDQGKLFKFLAGGGEGAKKANEIAAKRQKKEALDNLQKDIDYLVENYSSKILQEEQDRKKSEQSGTGKDKLLKDKKDHEWKLEDDKNFLKERIRIQQAYNEDCITTEEDRNNQLLQLEIDYLTIHLKHAKAGSEDYLRTEELLTNKLTEQKNNKKKRESELLKFNEEISKKYIENLEKQNEHERTLFKTKNNEEFASITTLEQAKAILRDTMSADELNKVTNLYDAKKLVREKYDRQESKMAADQLQLLYNIYSKIATDGSFNLADRLFKITPEQKAELQKELEKLQAQIAEMKANGNKGTNPEKKKEGGEIGINDIDPLGFSSSQWQMLFENLKLGESGIGDMAMAANALINIWSKYDDILKKSEEKELTKFVANQDKKKKTLQKRLDQGRVSQESFNAQVEAMDAETERKKAVIARNQAIRERNIALMSAIVNTAAGVTKSFSDPGGYAGAALAIMIGIAGGVQIGTIMGTEIPEIPGAESGGGLLDVIRSQDGKSFKAENNQNKRGFVDKPTIIAGENGTEYVMSAESLRNPAIMNMVKVIEQARLSGSLARINLPQVLNVSGMVAGGYVSASESSSIISSKTEIINNQTIQLNELSAIMKQLADRLDQGIEAKTYLRGPRGFYEAVKEDEKIKSNAKL